MIPQESQPADASLWVSIITGLILLCVPHACTITIVSYTEATQRSSMAWLCLYIPWVDLPPSLVYFLIFLPCCVAILLIWMLVVITFATDKTLWAGWQGLQEYNGRHIWGSRDVILSIYRTYFPFTYCQLNVIKWVSFLPYIWELAGSDLDPETCRPDCGFLWFSSDHPGKYRVVLHIRPWPHP